jgi:hypothetical protein
VVPLTIAADRAPGVVVEDLGPAAPRRTIGYLATPELARSTAVRELVRELRAERTSSPPHPSDTGGGGDDPGIMMGPWREEQ